MPAQGASDYTLYHGGAVAGAVVDASLKNIRSGAAEAAIPFGRFVVRGTEDDQVRLPAATGEIAGALGISVRIQNRAPAAVNDVLRYEEGDDVSILDFGEVWMVVEDAVDAGDPVFVRHAGGNEGAVRSDVDGGDATALTTALFMSSAGAGELVKVRFRAA